eukprot:GHUV01021087.1.p1 GENE.GHUV01021087.1~~GHUV01021087.1.p1  ORF type:complete len:502 (+),score=114.24 GHUV01021087.1:180-1685(+)
MSRAHGRRSHHRGLDSKYVAHAGLLQRIAPVRAAVAATRRVHAQVATTEASQRLEEVSSAGSATPAVDPYVVPPVNHRELPTNYAPETRFTVDSVAAADALRFRLDPSVEFWANHLTRIRTLANSRSFSDVPSQEITNRQRLADLVATVTDLLSTSALQDAESAAYWTYHLGRAGFFLGASAGGAIAHHLSEQFSALSSSKEAARTPLQNLSANATSELTNRLAECIAVWKQDLENIKKGLYKLPWDMTTLSHRQYNPLFVLSRSAQFFSEAIYTLNRRINNADPNNWFSTNMYPKYYADNTFHYQTDGWFSSGSANVYEFSTEALFFGRQDAMQRTTLVPLAEHIRATGADPAGMTLLEVSCGTGRFHTFVKDNYPTMSTIASDLSPFYLSKARDNVKYWKSMRAASLDLGGTDKTGTDYMQCAMESIPLPDASVDAVLCVYSFHEMPEGARLAAVQEFYRVLKPGGLAVLTDSAQLGDRLEWDRNLGQFGNFNEPHYRY